MKIVLTPDWFLGKDVMIEVFSFLVLLAFVVLCWRYYQLSKKKSFMYLGSGFLLIALAQIAMVVTKLVLYYDTTFVQEIGQIVVSYNVVKSVDIFYYIGFFFHRLFTLLGLYIIYRLPMKKKSAGEIFLAMYFILISALFSSSIFFLFHITTLVLLVMIIANYYEIYKKNKLETTKILLVAFSILALAHFIFTFSGMEVFFAVANVFELISYVILLVLIIKLLKHGTTQKKSDGNYR